MTFDRELVFKLNLAQVLDLITGWQFKKNVSIVLSKKAYDIVALELDTLGKLHMLYSICFDRKLPFLLFQDYPILLSSLFNLELMDLQAVIAV